VHINNKAHWTEKVFRN